MVTSDALCEGQTTELVNDLSEKFKDCWSESFDCLISGKCISWDELEVGEILTIGVDCVRVTIGRGCLIEYMQTKWVLWNFVRL